MVQRRKQQPPRHQRSGQALSPGGSAPTLGRAGRANLKGEPIARQRRPNPLEIGHVALVHVQVRHRALGRQRAVEQGDTRRRLGPNGGPRGTDHQRRGYAQREPPPPQQGLMGRLATRRKHQATQPRLKQAPRVGHQSIERTHHGAKHLLNQQLSVGRRVDAVNSSPHQSHQRCPVELGTAVGTARPGNGFEARPGRGQGLRFQAQVGHSSGSSSSVPRANMSCRPSRTSRSVADTTSKRNGNGSLGLRLLPNSRTIAFSPWAGE